MSTKIAVNLPVKDLAASTRFFTALGFARDERLANATMEAVVIGDDINVLLVVDAQFKAITKKDITYTAITSEAILQLQVESRQRVDELAARPKLPLRAKLPRPRWPPLGRLLDRQRGTAMSGEGIEQGAIAVAWSKQSPFGAEYARSPLA